MRGFLTRVSPARRAEVLAEVQEGSKPTATYYVLLGISELIAGFALIIDSDATLIGANLVAPLMLPIFGVALGLARGDLRLLRTALIAEFGGAAVGVALCFLLGLLPFAVPAFLMIGVWPLIMGITMFLQMRMNPTPPDPTQAMLFNWMPLIFTFMLATFPAGLVIYWAWNNLLSIAQQWVIMRRVNATTTAPLVTYSVFSSRLRTIPLAPAMPSPYCAIAPCGLA